MNTYFQVNTCQLSEKNKIA